METLKKRINDIPFIRWLAVVLTGFIMLGTYYFNDCFNPIKNILQLELKFTNTDYGLFTGSVGFVNIFGMIVLGGIILDKLGIRKTGLLFISVCSFGALLTAYGMSDYFNQGGFGYQFFSSFLTQYSPQLKVAMLGRLLFGIGLETTCILISKVAVKWFTGRNLALALGVSLSLGRVGQFLALKAPLGLVKIGSSWTSAAWAGAILVTLGFFFFMIYWIFDAKLDKEIKAEKGTTEEEKFKISDVGKLFTNKSFMYINMLCLTFYAGYFPFVNYAPDMLMNKFKLSAGTATNFVIFIPIGAIIFTPIFGAMIDRIGKAATIMIGGSIILILVHLSIALTTIPPYIPFVLLGITFSLVPAAMWPSLAKVVPQSRLGSAYGVIFSVQNWGLTFVPILLGRVLDATNPGITAEMVKAGQASYNYTKTILVLVVFGIAALIFAFLLKREDKVSGYGLEKPHNEKKKEQE